MSDIGGTSWYKVLSTYWDNTGGTPKNAVFVASYFVNKTNYQTSINQWDIEQTILGSNIIAGKIAAVSSSEDPLNLNCYNVFPSDDVMVNKVSYSSEGVQYATADCLSICGFHTYANIPVNGVSTRIKYTIVANQASRNGMSTTCGCTWWSNPLASPTGNYIADSFIYMVTHEIGELVTDSSNGWNTCKGCDGEVGDLCGWRTGSGSYGDFLYYSFTNVNGYTAQANIDVNGRYYHVSSLWVNYGNGCCSVSWPFDYSHGEFYTC